MLMLTLDSILSKVQDIPPLPDVMVKILRLTNDDDSSAKDLVEVMRLDPGITSQVLRLCNSAFFGLPREVTSLQHAVVYLGMKEIVNIVMMGCAGRYYDTPHPAYGLEKGELWRHSVAVAVVSQCLARQIGYEDHQSTFTAGLLHDLGKIVLHEYVHQNLDEIQYLIDTHEISFNAAEKEIIGYNHAEVGDIVASSWNLPEDLHMAIRHHHDHDVDCPSKKIVAIVHAANQLCHTFKIGSSQERNGIYPVFPEALEILGQSQEYLLALEDTLFEQYQSAQDLVSM